LFEGYETIVEDLRRAVERVFRVESISVQSPPHFAVRFRGHLLYDPETAYEFVSRDLRALGYTPLFRQDEQGQSIIAVPGTIEATPSNKWLSIALFAITTVSVFIVGMGMGEKIDLVVGAMFALALMGSLLAHELGHYFVARHFGAPVSPPYFIPMPISPLGTMGAIIRMKAPPPDRKALITIGAAGPIAGLLVAIPTLIIGLLMSRVEPLPSEGPFFMEGNSILYALIKFLIFGKFLPGGGEDVFLHPVAFAGWAGLMITGLNLIPAGQLDGGHIAYAILGRKARALTTLIILVLIALGFIWNGWFVWAIFIALFGRYHATPLNEITPLQRKHYLLGAAVFILFAHLVTPVPIVSVH